MSQNGNVVPLGNHPRARAHLTPQESAGVLKGCREFALDRMTSALAGMLDRVEDELFELADKTIDRDAQNVYLDARSQARTRREAIESTFRQHFVEFFNRKVAGDAVAPPAQDAELSLVAHEALEEALAVSAMSSKLQSACETELFALGQRMGFLLERPELEDDANPVSPATICAALKDACDQIQAGFKVRMALLHQLEHHTEGVLQLVYRDLNAHLVERRILPEVRARARRSPATGEPRKPAAVPGAGNHPSAPEDLFGTLAGLLRATEPRVGAAAAAGNAQATGSAPQADFVAELTRIHRQAAPAGDAGALVNVIKDLKNAPQGAALGGLDAMTIDIVAMLFDFVFEDRHIPSSVKALLARLQIPTLKVALLDKTFFSSKSHPARRLIDLLAEASIGLDDGGERGQATLALIENVVDGILHDFETDLALFGAMVARVEAFMEEQGRAEAEIVQRSTRLIEAREREEIARVIGQEEVARRLQVRVWVPAVVREMLLDSWVGALASVQLAEGEGSPAWQALIRTMDDLLWSVEPKSSPEDRKRMVGMLPGMLRELHQGFARGAMTDARRDAFLGTLVDCHAMAVKAGLRGMAAVPVPATPPAVVAPTLEREILPAGDLQVEEIRLRVPRGGAVRNVFTRTGIWTNLQRGTWVEFERAAAAPLRARLTWISPNKGVYLFTNPSAGVNAVSISPDALAEQLRLGEARVIDGAPLVDRAVDSMLDALRKSQGR